MNNITSGALGNFQDQFWSLLAPDGISTHHALGLASQPGFAVYRNTIANACIEALLANYPVVARLTGDEWFRAAAHIYFREQPPRSPLMLEYGHDFANFLEAFAPAADLPYLPGVARLDRHWSEAHGAADSAVLDSAWIASLDPAALAELRLTPHPAARWTWCSDFPIATLWQRSRDPNDDCDFSDITWRGEGLLTTRPQDSVVHAAIGPGVCALLDACKAGHTLGESANAALEADPQCDLAESFRVLLEAGAFTALHDVPDGTPLSH